MNVENNSRLRLFCLKAIFSWGQKVIQEWFGFTLLRSAFGLLAPLSQPISFKTKTNRVEIATWSLAFSRASGSLIILTLDSNWLLAIFSIILNILCSDWLLWPFWFHFRRSIEIHTVFATLIDWFRKLAPPYHHPLLTELIMAGFRSDLMLANLRKKLKPPKLLD